MSTSITTASAATRTGSLIARSSARARASRPSQSASRFSGSLPAHRWRSSFSRARSRCSPTFLRSFRGEKLAGLAVVLAIFVSAAVALYETIQRLIHPQALTHLWVLAAAGVIGFIGNEVAAQIRLRGGRRLSSPALIADGNHARVDGFVSLGVVVTAVLVALGVPRADPIIALAITLVILKITWDSWRVVSTTDPGEHVEPQPR